MSNVKIIYLLQQWQENLSSWSLIGLLKCYPSRIIPTPKGPGPSIEVLKERMVDYSRVERFAGTTRKPGKQRSTTRNGWSEYQVVFRVMPKKKKY